MSNCRRMSHHDVGAPPLYGYKRESIYQFLDVIFTTGYNLQYVNNFVRTGRELLLNFADPHGYVEGHLLLLQGSAQEVLNDKLYRVTEVPSNTSLKLYIKEDIFEGLPEMATESNMTCKVAPLNWEKLYESTTQRSYRSRLEKSSKIIVTFKQPTYHATQLKTTNAVCYEMDLSKDIDLETGSTIDSCFSAIRASKGHSAQYFVTSTNSDNLASSPTWTDAAVHRSPWTVVGDESMVYFFITPYVDGYYENGSYRQYATPQDYNGAYRFVKCFAFGDIEALDPNEYLTGSSFYFHFYYFEATNSFSGSITAPLSNPFIRQGSQSWYDYYFTTYDPSPTYAQARVTTLGVPYYSTGDGSSCSWSNYGAYPQRVTGGLNYFDYLAYNNNTIAQNNSDYFLKGTFKYVKYSDCNLRNIGVIRDLHNRILPTDKPYKKLYLVTNSTDNWSTYNYYGNYLFELD